MAFASFECWSGDEGEPWVREVEDFIRGFVLGRPNHTFGAWRDQQLIGVASFYEKSLGLPLNNPVEVPVWHLEVLGVALDLQGEGIGRDLLASTLGVMRQLDVKRRLVTGYVHVENHASHRLCSSAGLEPLTPLDAHYWIYVGPL